MPKIKPGAMVTITETITYGDKKRASNFKGLVIARKHGAQKNASFTVRSVVDNVAVEKVYPFYSPLISGVKVHSTPQKIKRSKLYFARDISKKKMQKKLGVSI